MTSLISEAEQTEALAEAVASAEAIRVAFEAEWAGSQLDPRVTVDLRAGEDDEPVFVFRLLLAVGDDLDPDDFPASAVAQLTGDLRSRILGSSVSDWAYTVMAASGAGDASR